MKKDTSRDRLKDTEDTCPTDAKKPTNGKYRRKSQRGANGYNSNKNRYNVADRKERFDAAKGNNMWNSAGNDPKWYNQFPDLLRNFASYNFRAPVGSQVVLDPVNVLTNIDADRYPGVMALYFCPAMGSQEDGNASMLNTAATRLYQFTRFENNGSSMYSRGSLMLYFLAMDSCYMYHAWLKRIYSEMRMFSNMNRYTPRALMRAERVDYEDLEQKLPKLRGWINEFADKLSVLPIPHSMSYMARHAWMANSLFVDTNTVKCQFYMYVPQYFQLYRVADGTGTLPAATPWLQYVNPSYGNPALKLEELIQFGKDMIEPLVADEDFNRIGADVLKAFGSNGVVILDPIPDDYLTPPVYSEEVLNQINNATAIGHPACYGSAILPAQNSGASVFWDKDTNKLIPNDMVWVPFGKDNRYQLATRPNQLNKIVNFESDTITNDDIMVATRLTQICHGPAISITGNDGMTYVAQRYYTLGSEFICQFSMFFYTTADNGEWRIGNTTLGYFSHPQINTLPWGDQSTSSADWTTNTVTAEFEGIRNMRDHHRFLANLAQFNRHPYVMLYGLNEYVEDDGTGTQTATYKGHNFNGFYDTAKLIGDTANFAVFEEVDLIDLANVALQSEFFVPLTASGALKTTAI